MGRTTHYEKRMEELRTIYSVHKPQHQELSDFIVPFKGRFQVTDGNKGGDRYNQIINDAATRAQRTMTAGLMAGITSPARPWFRLETPDKEMMEFGPVKNWLNGIEMQMRDVFSQSNFYNALPGLYTEEGTFATGAMMQVDDFEDVTRFHNHSIGSYYIATSERGTVDSFYREYENTVAQIVAKFGIDNVSEHVSHAYAQSRYDQRYPVHHCIEPNVGRDIDSPWAEDKPFRSVYYEPGCTNDKFLRRSGFNRFPVRVPRWETTAEDIWGTNSPGIMALGGTKQLQFEEREKGKAIAKKITPALKGPPSLKNMRLRQLPGSAVLYANNDPNSKDGLSPIHEPNISLSDLREDIAQVVDRIEKAHYVDVFFAISQMQGVQPRNIMELSERKEEALLQLGPMLQQQHTELLDPTIDETFYRMLDVGMVPEPPPELENTPLKIEYISVLAQAQRAIGVGTIERVAGYVGGLVASGLSDGKKFDADQSIDEYAHMTGVMPKIIRTDDAVEEMRAAEAEQAQMEQMAAMAAPANQAMDAVGKAGEMVEG